MVATYGTGRILAATADGGDIDLPRPVPVSPLDTTGAGDSFNAAYLAARLAEETIEVAAEKGQALSAKVVRVRGGLL
ncbi:PfkB family carbohydrate kinase [Phaeobacter sp. CAU 1743]|uniref:PfkB family carbohydrate kinase n=1 Tax=Phaeobacter sp. CAU 1743 TaxID=3140367 RepID=UPI00325BB0F3